MLEGSSGGGSVLYDVLVYNEWRQEEEEVKEEEEGADEGGGARARWRSWGAWKMLGGSGGTGGDGSLQRVRQLRELRSRWQMSVSADAAMVALAQEATLEILLRRAADSASSPSYVCVARAELPPDPYPNFRKLAWSTDDAFVAVTTSNGRVLIYDATGDLV